MHSIVELSCSCCPALQGRHDERKSFLRCCGCFFEATARLTSDELIGTTIGWCATLNLGNQILDVSQVNGVLRLPASSLCPAIARLLLLLTASTLRSARQSPSLPDRRQPTLPGLDKPCRGQVPRAVRVCRSPWIEDLSFVHLLESATERPLVRTPVKSGWL